MLAQIIHDAVGQMIRRLDAVIAFQAASALAVSEADADHIFRVRLVPLGHAAVLSIILHQLILAARDDDIQAIALQQVLHLHRDVIGLLRFADAVALQAVIHSAPDGRVDAEGIDHHIRGAGIRRR